MKIKKAFLTLLIAAFSAALALGLASCTQSEAACTHDYQWQTTLPATCTLKGTESLKCTQCGDVKETREIKALGHNYEWVLLTAERCDEDGAERRECTRCGLIGETRVRPAAHSWVGVDDGVAHHLECEFCGETTEAEAHIASGEWLSANGKHYQECAVCGAQMLTAVHTESAYAYVDENTCATHCEICGVTISESKHDMSEEWRGNNEQHYHECNLCGYTTDITTHTYNRLDYAAFKSDGEGRHYHVCDVCGLRCDEYVCSGSNPVPDGDTGYHYYTCTYCKGECYRQKHYAGPTSAWYDQGDGTCAHKCEVCGAPCEPTPHLMAEVYTSDVNNHYHLCLHCGIAVDPEPHDFGDDGKAAKCAVCGRDNDTLVEESEFVTEPSDLGGLKLTAYNSTRVYVQIPDEIDGQPIVEIGDQVFYNKPILTVEIPETVKKIGKNAFRATLLTQVTLPEVLESLGDYAFLGSKLTSVDVPESVTEFGVGVFRECKDLLSASGFEGVTVLADSLFSQCTSLAAFTIPEGIQTIDTDAFYNCAFTTIDIPESVTTLGYRCFYGNEQLLSITGGENVEYLMGWNFANCTKITHISLPKVHTYEKGGFFSHCESLVEYYFPENLTKFSENQTFMYCYALKRVALSKTMTSVPALAGAQLDWIYIPFNVGNCTNYNSPTSVNVVYYDGTQEQWQNFLKSCEATAKTAFTAATCYSYSEAYNADGWHWKDKTTFQPEPWAESSAAVANVPGMDIALTCAQPSQKRR